MFYILIRRVAYLFLIVEKLWTLEIFLFADGEKVLFVWGLVSLRQWRDRFFVWFFHETVRINVMRLLRCVQIKPHQIHSDRACESNQEIHCRAFGIQS